MNKFKGQVLAYIKGPNDRATLAESRERYQRFDELPDELFETAEQMSPPGASFAEKLDKAQTILVEAVKLAEAAPGEGPAARIAAAVAPAAADTKGTAPSFAESRPDVMLAKLAHEIRLSEGVDYGQALNMARQRDPELAQRYRDAVYGGPAATSTGERPDVELAERTKARMEKDGLGYAEAMRLELAEDPALAERYHDDGAREPARVKPPMGMCLVTERPDVQLAERVKARQERDGVDWSEAARLELADDPALASRYADFQSGRTALDEASYRAETIRAAHHGRIGHGKAFNAALAEDPKLRAGVEAYFEKIN